MKARLKKEEHKKVKQGPYGAAVLADDSSAFAAAPYFLQKALEICKK